MKLLHTSDWHLGATLYRQTRAPDHDAVIAEIIEVARRFGPDLICHTGDLFDRARPATEDIARAGHALRELASIAPVVVVCGNHDSASLLDALNVYMRISGGSQRVHFVARVRSPRDGVLQFPTRRGHTIRLAALPFQHAHLMTDAFGDPTQWGADYSAQVRGIEAALGEALLANFNPITDVAVFAAHLYVGGADYCGSERGMHVDGTYATDLDAVPTVSYAAFGHLHKPQPLPGKRVTGRYAGSPIALDFGEVYDKKSVVLVEAEPGRPASVETVRLTAGRRLRKFHGTLQQLEALASEITDDLCLVAVATPTHIPTLIEQVRRLLPRATLLDVHPARSDGPTDILTADQVDADAEPNLTELFTEFIAERGTRTAGPQQVLDAFTRVLAAVEEDREPVFAEEALLTTAASADSSEAPV
ncbi:metallophosphoesterase family protein [Micromonospora aurantiaca (nom. illeg.)]|uniref:metallophosphoesterase family protein n=1 Tax=Micromonospora aurantiaca (nom. illeg.) TaxID=47850 RepID=UPI000827B5ED|nr:exonuclease SbcCD subunit D [Micromonospora aurantiaca]SCL36187.1 Exodeoxyribonuclease I subunit D [Micromonospora aurantiaca]